MKEYLKKNKEAIIGVLVFVGYLLLSFLSSDILTLLGYNTYPKFIRVIITIIYDLFILLTIIFIYLRLLVKDLKDFKKNFKFYIDNYLKYWFLNLGLMLISNLIITNITNIDTSTNQEYITKLLGTYPIYMIISAVLIAPLTEELIFRLNFKKIFTSNLIYIILSGLTFGAMHLSVATSIEELLYIIPYSVPGFIFAYTYTKSKNIYVPISLHLLHNTFTLILQLITILT